jgi:phosphoribosylformylglycinamidine synthase
VLVGGLGESTPEQFGSSEYVKVILKQLWGEPPALDMVYEKRVHEAMREIASSGLAESAHDLSDGGLAVALAECCTPDIGAQIAIASGSGSPVISLFHEAPSRILVSTRSPEQIEEIMLRYGIYGEVIGITMKERLQIHDNDRGMLIDVSTKTLCDRAENALPEMLHASR